MFCSAGRKGRRACIDKAKGRRGVIPAMPGMRKPVTTVLERRIPVTTVLQRRVLVACCVLLLTSGCQGFDGVKFLKPGEVLRYSCPIGQVPDNAMTVTVETQDYLEMTRLKLFELKNETRIIGTKQSKITAVAALSSDKKNLEVQVTGFQCIHAAIYSCTVESPTLTDDQRGTRAETHFKIFDDAKQFVYVNNERYSLGTEDIKGYFIQGDTGVVTCGVQTTPNPFTWEWYMKCPPDDAAFGKVRKSMRMNEQLRRVVTQDKETFCLLANHNSSVFFDMTRDLDGCYFQCKMFDKKVTQSERTILSNFTVQVFVSWDAKTKGYIEQCKVAPGKMSVIWGSALTVLQLALAIFVYKKRGALEKDSGFFWRRRKPVLGKQLLLG